MLLAQAVPRWTYHGESDAGKYIGPGWYTELTAQQPAVPAAGTYFVSYKIALSDTTPGDGPLVCQMESALFVNHVQNDPSGSTIQGHFHCPQATIPGAGTGPPWAITIGIGAIDGTNPTAPLTLGALRIGGLSAGDYYAGEISWSSVKPREGRYRHRRRRAGGLRRWAHVSILDLTIIHLGP